MQNAGPGTILDNARGRTLYLFKKDVHAFKGDSSLATPTARD